MEDGGFRGGLIIEVDTSESGVSRVVHTDF